MVEPCFIKKGSDIPVCGLHNVPLVNKQLPEELIASGCKSFAFFVCPVSSQVIDDPEKHK
jgi:hypothetical protein